MKRRSVVRAYENIRPDEAAKERMLQNILHSSEISPAGKDERIMRKKMRPMVLVALVALIAAMTVTVFASEVISGWFRQYFEKINSEPLTSEQIEYIEEKEQIVFDTQTHDDFELKLKSVLADGNTLYITLGITSPEALPFDEYTMFTASEFDLYNQKSHRPNSTSTQVIDDLDGLDTTVDLLIKADGENWNSDDNWILYVEKLEAMVYDAAYEQELLDTKYAGQKNIMFTDEEAAKIYSFVTLAEGPWEFAVDMSKADGEELEMLTDSIRTKGCSGYKADGTIVYEDVLITSVVLRPLSATFYSAQTDSRAALDITPTADYQIFVVMKNGERIELLPEWAAVGEAHFTAGSPIILSEVDHILLPDGTVIKAP